MEQWKRDNKELISDSGADDAADIGTMLCIPIVNANKDVIGVAQLINKVSLIVPAASDNSRNFFQC